MTEKTPRSTKKSEEMGAREKILDAAVKCYARGDVFHITTRMIADEAGVALGLINYYFPNSKKIFWACIRHIYELSGIGIRPYLKVVSDEEKVFMVIKANFEWFVVQKPEYYRCILLSYYLATVDDDLQKLHQELYEEVMTKLTDIILKSKKRVTEKAAKELAMSIWNEMEGGLLFASFVGGRSTKTWVKNQIESIQRKLEAA